MRTKLLTSAICISLLFLATCKKNDNTSTPNASAAQQNTDVSDNKSASDDVNADINNVLSNVSAFGKTGQTQTYALCGAKIDTTLDTASIPTIVITYDSTTICPNPNRIRSGTVMVQLINGKHWSDAGAELKVTLTNYKVVFTNLNNHYLIFNGVKYLTDVNGIYWWEVLLGTDTLTLKERTTNMQVTFDNGASGTWNVARLSKWGLTNNWAEVYTIVNGDTTVNGQVLDDWGISRTGSSFTTVMNQPWESNTTCGWWNPTSGQYTCSTSNFTITATFGVDKNGNPVTTACGAYGLKLAWTLLPGNTSGSAIIEY